MTCWLGHYYILKMIHGLDIVILTDNFMTEESFIQTKRDHLGFSCRQLSGLHIIFAAIYSTGLLALTPFHVFRRHIQFLQNLASIARRHSIWGKILSI
jgi:hypothetical protein